MPEEKSAIVHCSFCGKSQYEVLKLIAGPNVFICEECTELCIKIFLEEIDEKTVDLKGLPHLESLTREVQGKEN